MSDVPQGWSRVRIHDIAEKIPTGDRYDSNTVASSGCVPVIDQSENGCIGYHNNLPGVSASDIDPVVTFANHTCAVRLMKKPFSTIQNVFAFRGTSVDTRFVYHLLYKRIPMVFYGGHYPILATEKFLLPPLPEQRKIAEILDSVDENIEKTQALIAKLQDLKKAVMQELLTKGIGHTKFKDSPVGRRPEEWSLKRLGDVADVVTGGTPPTNNAEYYGGSIPWIKPDRLGLQVYVSDSDTYLTDDGAVIARLLPKGTVLVSCIGNIGKTAIASCPLTCNQQINALIPHEDTDSNYLHLACQHYRGVLERNASINVVPILNKSTFADIRLPFPPLPEQRKIAEILDSVDENIEKTQALIAKLQDLKKALMQDLLTGRVRVKV